MFKQFSGKSLFGIKKGNPIVANMNSILHNVYILYIIFVIALMNLYYLVSSSNYVYSAIFILVGFLTSFFSKNMIVILCIAMTITNVLRFGRGAATEGFDQQDESNKEGMDDDEDDDASDDSKKNSKSVDNSSETMAGITNDYKELQRLQDEIVGGMEKLADPLEKAENILDRMSKQLNVKI